MQFASLPDAQTLVDACPFPMLLLDGKGHVAYGSQALAELIAPVALSDLQGRQPHLIDSPGVTALLTAARNVEWRDDKGTTRHFKVTSVKLPGQGEARFFIDCTAEAELRASNRRLAEELRNTTLTDSMTGLFNERGVSLALEPQVARCRRYNSPLSVIAMQVGAPAPASQVLIEVARLLKDQLRWADIIGCTERGLFLLVLPETSVDAAMQLIDKLRSLLIDLGQRIFDGADIQSTYGLAGWRKSDTASTLMARATGALADKNSATGRESLAL
jgi:GGDEF domain-containing protein